MKSAFVVCRILKPHEGVGFEINGVCASVADGLKLCDEQSAVAEFVIGEDYRRTGKIRVYTLANPEGRLIDIENRGA